MSKPQFRIETSGGVDLTAQIAQRLIFLRILDEAGFTNDRMELQMDNRPPYLELPTEGQSFVVYMGYDGELRQMGTYEFDEATVWGPPHSITITAHAKDTGSSIKSSQTRSWHNMAVKDIVKDIAGANGLGVVFGGNVGANIIEHIEQSAHSDMGFLTDLARSNNAIMKIDNGQIYFAAQDPGGKVASADIPFTQDVKYTFITQNRGKYQGVKAAYHDKATGKEMVVGAGNILGAAVHKLGEIFTDKTAAANAAMSTKAQMDRTVGTLEVTCPGNPLIMSETPVTTVGFPPPIPETWTADRVEHIFSGKGSYQTLCVLVTPKGSTSDQADQGVSAPQEEKADNKEGAGDGHTVTESVDDDKAIST